MTGLFWVVLMIGVIAGSVWLACLCERIEIVCDMIDEERKKIDE